MPTKDLDFKDFITGYDWSYHNDSGLWYEDEKEDIPMPKSIITPSDNFTMTYFNGFIYPQDVPEDDVTFEDNTQEDIDEHAKYLLKKSDNDAYTFSIVFDNNNQTKFYLSIGYCQSTDLEIMKFLRKVKDAKPNEKACSIYLEQYSDVKLFVYVLNNNKIRLIIQSYYRGTKSFLSHIMDVIIDKEYFIEQFETSLARARNLLRESIFRYMKEEKLDIKEVKKKLFDNLGYNSIMDFKREKPICPYCGSKDNATYLWGEPLLDEKLYKAIDEGKTVLGGCCVSKYSPRYKCNKCHKDFGIIGDL